MIKKFLFYSLFLLGIVLIGTNAYSDDLILNLGLGVGHSSDFSKTETKSLYGSLQETLWNDIKMRGNSGFWLDNAGNGRSSSGFISGQLGIEVENRGFIASVFSGPALITSTDNLLGGYFQFHNTFGLGMVDENGTYLGISYNHFSSAGLETPNTGRDIIGLQCKFNF